MRILQAAAVLAIIAGLFWAGLYARDELGLELSAESIATVVAGLGLWAWLVYLVIVVFRTFLGLPSMIVLIAGGAAFGPVIGAMLGAAGIIISAFLWYVSARWLGRDFIHEWLGVRAADFQRRAEAAGPFVVGISTAHPAGPLTPFHLGSGLAALPLPDFAVAVILGSPVRATTLAFFGSTLLEFGTPRFYLATAVVLVFSLLPLAFRPVRERVFGAFRAAPPPAPTSSGPSSDRDA